MLANVRDAAIRRDWGYVIEHGLPLLPTLHGEDRAKVHLYISAAYASVATCADDWRAALAHAHGGREHSVAGTMVHTWALQKLSSILVDMGRPAEAHRYATAYLKVAHLHPVLEFATPYAVRDLGHVAYQQRRFRAALHYFGQAFNLFAALGNIEEASRTTCTNLVWANLHLGRVDEAKVHADSGISEELEYLRFGALAALSYAEGKYAMALRYGSLALESRREGFDFVDAAEVCLIMAKASRALGAVSESRSYITEARNFASYQAQDLRVLITLTLTQAGGEFQYEESARGSSDPRHRGCLTTGIA
jgi:tetratricopeptide (TPR) repeat protein